MKIYTPLFVSMSPDGYRVKGANGTLLIFIKEDGMTVDGFKLLLEMVAEINRKYS